MKLMHFHHDDHHVVFAFGFVVHYYCRPTQSLSKLPRELPTLQYAWAKIHRCELCRAVVHFWHILSTLLRSLLLLSPTVLLLVLIDPVAQIHPPRRESWFVNWFVSWFVTLLFGMIPASFWLGANHGIPAIPRVSTRFDFSSVSNFVKILHLTMAMTMTKQSGGSTAGTSSCSIATNTNVVIRRRDFSTTLLWLLTLFSLLLFTSSSSRCLFLFFLNQQCLFLSLI
jgi:hypothetical protein